MTTLIAIHEVDDVDHWLKSPKREEVFGPLGIVMRTFVDPRAADGYDKNNGFDDITHTQRNGTVEHRPGVAERVELAVLAARVDACRQFREQFEIK